MRTDHAIGIGATSDLSLRVSAGALVRVLFEDPEDSRTMLALERTATLRGVEARQEVVVTSKPFGGAVRLTDASSLSAMVGGFHFDSDRSRQERDFRILIRPSSWQLLKEFCLLHLDSSETTMIDASPDRELVEEFEDTLGVAITPELYTLASRGMAVEDIPVATDNVRTPGSPTVRIYFVYEAWIRDKGLIAKMQAGGAEISDSELERLAWDDARDGGEGRSNAILVTPLDDLLSAYRSVPINERVGRIRVNGHELGENVLAILDEIEQVKYLR